MTMLYLLYLVSLVKFSASTWTEAGCYKLSDLESYLTSQGEYLYQTNGYCEEQCADYQVAATLDGSTCYCGDSLPSSIDSVSSSNCDVTCQGYGTEICGGDGYLTVYTTGQEDTSSDSSSSGDDSSSSTTSTTSTSTSNSATSSTSPTTTTSSSTTSTSTTSTSSTDTESSTSTSTASQSASLVTSVEVITSIAGAGTKVSTLTSVISTSNPVPTSDNSDSSTTSSNDSNNEDDDNSLSKGAVAGIAVGSALGALTLVSTAVFGCLYVYRRRAQNDDDEYDTDSMNKRLPDTPPVHGSGYGGYYGFEQPISYYGDDDDKRLSNGSLAPEGIRTGNECLRVMNPDDSEDLVNMRTRDSNVPLPDTRLHDSRLPASINDNELYSSDEDDWKK